MRRCSCLWSPSVLCHFVAGVSEFMSERQPQLLLDSHGSQLLYYFDILLYSMIEMARFLVSMASFFTMAIFWKYMGIAWSTRHAMKKRKFDVGECSHNSVKRRSIEGMSDDQILESKHKIFLSHSGIQKDFVEHLCKALEDRCYYPFFDRRSESLLKGIEFSGLIVKAVQQCQLLVVVVSEDYFMSKWPMIELNAFVQATKVIKSNMNVAILPLFYGLSVSDLKDEKRRRRWFEKWMTFAKDDVQIKVEDWKYALNELTKFNGLSYDRELKPIVAYENEIVSHICRLVLPDIKWDDSHAQGNAHEVIIEKMKQIEFSQRYKVKVVGIYGVGGIGKTTMCKRLCNDLISEYEGRVCHVEIDIKCSNSKELLQKVCVELTRKRVEVVQQLAEGECVDILRKNLSNQRTLLALDNVWDNDKSLKQAQLFLNMNFHRESFVVVMARSHSTLERLGIDKIACFEMPELSRVEATKLFLYYAANGKHFATFEDEHSIDLCVAKCSFCKGDGRGFHYHPLALEVLGRQLSCLGELPFEWEQKLEEGSRETAIFDVLGIGFNLLQIQEQALFMDVFFFTSPNSWAWQRRNSLNKSLFGWREHLSILHKKNDRDIQSRLDNLIGKGLLQDSNFSSGKIGIHDLYIEFAKLEAEGKFGEATDIWNRRWMHVIMDDGDLSELEIKPAGVCWERLSRLSIQQYEYLHCPTNPITSLEGIEWRYFSNVLMLHLDSLTSVHGKLNLEGMQCLRSLRLHNLKFLESLEGLSELANLTIFEWTMDLLFGDETRKTYFKGHFPASLKFLNVSSKGLVLEQNMEQNVLAGCKLLCKLSLQGVHVGELLDLSSCSSLDSLNLEFPWMVPTVLKFSASEASKLKSLSVKWNGFVINISIAIPMLDQVVGLEHLHLGGCPVEGLPSLLNLTKLQSLKLDGHGRLPELCIPRQVQELYYSVKGSIDSKEAPFLNGFEQLQVLDLSLSRQLTQFGMGDLPVLRSLNLRYCWYLEKLPDLRKSRSLQELNLDECFKLKLWEEDIQMLATLPLLHPVRFSKLTTGAIRLDFVRRKVLRHQGPSNLVPDSWLDWKKGEWEEKELTSPPLGIFS